MCLSHDISVWFVYIICVWPVKTESVYVCSIVRMRIYSASVFQVLGVIRGIPRYTLSIRTRKLYVGEQTEPFECYNNAVVVDPFDSNLRSVSRSLFGVLLR